VAGNNGESGIDHRDPDAAFGQHAGGVAVADLDRKGERSPASEKACRTIVPILVP